MVNRLGTSKSMKYLYLQALQYLQPETNHPTRAMNFGDFKDGKAQQPLPPSLAPHEAEINGFAEICNKTCTRILTLLALGLEVRNPSRSIYPPPVAYCT